MSIFSDTKVRLGEKASKISCQASKKMSMNYMQSLRGLRETHCRCC